MADFESYSSELPTILKDRDPESWAAYLKDVTNVNALINLVAPDFAENLMGIPDDLLSYSPEQFEKAMDGVPPLLLKLRANLWVAYDKRLVEKRRAKSFKQVSYIDLAEGVCSLGFVTKLMRERGIEAAYILVPPPEYERALDAVLVRGLERLEQIMNLPIYNKKTGEPDAAIAKVVLAAYKLVEDRVKGSVVQRAETKTLSVTADLRHRGSPHSHSADNADEQAEIQSRIKLLERKLHESGGVIPAEVVSVAKMAVDDDE